MSEDISKTLSYLLRHSDELTMDRHGWVKLKRLIEAVQFDRDCNRNEIISVLRSDERYEISGNNARALYGHSNSKDVVIGEKLEAPPTILYHGTAKRNLDPIMEKGLVPMSRMNVHLTNSPDEAKRVGERHIDSGEICILKVKCKQLVSETSMSVYHPSDDTYTVSHVPPEYISVYEIC